ncbi:TRAP transporter small permease [Chloroflexota bacterium]
MPRRLCVRSELKVTAKLINKASSFFDRTINYLAIIGIVLLVFVWLLVCFDVFLRYSLGTSIVWSAEITEYSLVHITFLSSAWLLKKDRHIKVDLITSRLNVKNLAILDISTSILCIILWLVISWYSIDALLVAARQNLYMTEAFLMPPKWIVHAVIPLGSLLLVIELIRRVNRSRLSCRKRHGEEA